MGCARTGLGKWQAESPKKKSDGISAVHGTELS